jgi:predicted nuclease with TOPRIM domain
MDREALIRRRDELQAACDAARERLNQNAGAVAAYNEIIALLDEEATVPESEWEEHT